MDLIMPRRALLSVYNKDGIIELAQGLHDLGIELLSSGGTATKIAEAGIPVIDVAELTGVPAILGHRVVTLHPKVHGGILADEEEESHREDMAEHGIVGIDLVVVNLYPFTSDPSIELIDIGGPTMVLGAAKNHKRTLSVVDPADYKEVLEKLEKEGGTTLDFRRAKAKKAFGVARDYYGDVYNWLDAEDGPANSPEPPRNCVTG